MGLETMAHEFYNARSTPLELEKNLITLARGKARLAKIGDVPGADVAQRVRPVSEGGQGLRFTSEVIDGAPGTVDEVEVHTGYQTRLSTSLELPLGTQLHGLQDDCPGGRYGVCQGLSPDS